MIYNLYLFKFYIYYTTKIVAVSHFELIERLAIELKLIRFILVAATFCY